MCQSLRATQLFALAAGMCLIVGVHASEAHEDSQAAASHEVVLKPPKIDLKADLKAEARAEARAEGRAEGIAEGKAANKSDRAVKGEGRSAKGEPKEAGAEKPASSVSMADLRDLIDQKIAEVRAKQMAAPAVKVVSRGPKAKRAPVLVASLAQGSGHGHDGALAPAAQATASQPGVMGHDIYWAYTGDTGPANWGTLKPEFQTCMLGKRQSPIDIRDGIKVNLEPIIFDYRPTAFRVIDNGHTIQVNVEPGNSIMVQGHRFDLIQFHFHRPSEERVNGRQSDMVAHLVHKDAEGKLAVVAVLLDQGDQPHPVVQLVWNSLPLEKNTEQYSPSLMDLNLLLPEHQQYYTYMGSLTTPPCSEGVLWMVMKQPAMLTREQVNIFSRLYPMNARPIQSAAGRMIKEGQ